MEPSQYLPIQQAGSSAGFLTAGTDFAQTGAKRNRPHPGRLSECIGEPVFREKLAAVPPFPHAGSGQIVFMPSL
jgi:hypothetical protein